jgi:hypothetical protein
MRLHIARGPQAVERGLQDRLKVAGVAVDRGDGHDHVEDLLEREVVADLMRALCGGQQGPASSHHPGPVRAEDGVAAAKLDASDALGALADEAGLTLIQMAIAFVTRHPAVTCAIIGPRTMEHLESYLAADGIDLSGDLLDRIDEIVPPADTVNVADNMWGSSTSVLAAAFRRR